MSAIVTQIFELVGPNKGKTIKLRQYQFVDGECPITAPVAELASHARFLGEVNGWARPKLNGVLEAPASSDPEDIDKLDPNDRLKRALLQLDHKNDEHWTQLGKPAMKAVEQLYGSADVTRAQVEAAIPGFLRDTSTPTQE